MKNITFTRGMVAGIAGGLAGTFLMYLFGAGIFALLGWPASTSFRIIGDSAAAFLSIFEIHLAGGVPLGRLLYCLVGLMLGVLFGVATVSLEPLRLLAWQKRVGISILYVEAMSVPLLAAGTLALEMSPADALLWFSISFVMHLVYGLALGVIASLGVSGMVLESPARSTKLFVELKSS